MQAEDSPLPVQPKSRWSRVFAVASAIVFFVSLVFPLAAGLSRKTAAFPKWWGALDVSLAFVLAILAFIILAITRDEISGRVVDASYKSYRVLIHLILALILIFFFFGDRIVWVNCATGFAWRAWLFLYCLPAWFAAFGIPSNERGGRR